ncbi:BCCT family transporter, partial [Vibrio parahaemolyticus]|nr:BCCT family transporter [Vibrio parahaemolyticus]
MSDLTNSMKASTMSVSSGKSKAKHNTSTTENTTNKLGLNNPAFWYSGGFIALFVAIALYDGELLSTIVNAGFGWAVQVFGPYWQLLLLLTFLIGLGLAAGRTGKVMLGGIAKPEMDSFRWMAIIFCTLLAGGGVFWAAAEPIAHYVSPPPLYGAQDNPQQGAVNALS